MASSSSVYGDRKHDGDDDKLGEDGEPWHAFRESDEVIRPASPYAATKASTELIAYTFNALYNLPVACLRFFTVYGPGGRPDMAPFKFVDRISNGLSIDRYGDGSAVRDFTYVTDIVDGTLLSLFKPQGFQIYNLGGGFPVTLAYFISLIEDGLGTKANIRELPPQPGDVGRTHASITKAKKLLAFEAKVRIEDGIKQTIAWYRDFAAECTSEEGSPGLSPAISPTLQPKALLRSVASTLEFEGSMPEPHCAIDGMLICTRVHGQDHLTGDQKLQLHQMFDTSMDIEGCMAVVAVEWTPSRMTLLEDVNRFVMTYAAESSTIQNYIKVCRILFANARGPASMGAIGSTVLPCILNSLYNTRCPIIIAPP